MVVCALGAVWVKRDEPGEGGNSPSKSVRIIFAIATAPATFTWPAPWSNGLNPASGCAVYIKIIFTMFGVRLGFASSNNAAVPATTGAETDVPLMNISFMFVVG